MKMKEALCAQRKTLKMVSWRAQQQFEKKREAHLDPRKQKKKESTVGTPAV